MTDARVIGSTRPDCTKVSRASTARRARGPAAEGADSAPPPTAHRVPETQPDSIHQAVTIAGVVSLLKLGTAIDARRRSAPPANGKPPATWQPRVTRSPLLA